MSDNIKPATEYKSVFEFQIVEIQGHKVLILSGEINAHTSPQFKQAITSTLDVIEQHLIIDMHKVSYIDSSSLGVLAFAVKRLSPNSGTVNLIGCNSRIDSMFRLTQMSEFIALHRNMNDALKAISTRASL